MIILFKDRKFEKQCNGMRELVRCQGQRRASLIREHLDNLDAAACLADMKSLPGRCHELTGNRKGELSLDLDHPYRLIFESADDPIPRKDDGGLDWNGVTQVLILGVDDTHDTHTKKPIRS